MLAGMVLHQCDAVVGEPAEQPASEPIVSSRVRAGSR